MTSCYTCVSSRCLFDVPALIWYRSWACGRARVVMCTFSGPIRLCPTCATPVKTDIGQVFLAEQPTNCPTCQHIHPHVSDAHDVKSEVSLLCSCLLCVNIVYILLITLITVHAYLRATSASPNVTAGIELAQTMLLAVCVATSCIGRAFAIGKREHTNSAQYGRIGMQQMCDKICTLVCCVPRHMRNSGAAHMLFVLCACVLPLVCDVMLAIIAIAMFIVWSMAANAHVNLYTVVACALCVLAVAGACVQCEWRVLVAGDQCIQARSRALLCTNWSNIVCQ